MEDGFTNAKMIRDAIFLLGALKLNPYTDEGIKKVCVI